MTRLWLDDVRPAPDGWEWVKTADEAIERLKAGGVVEVSLDHDLGSDFGPPEPTGYTVAAWIELAAHLGALPRLVWNVHSANPVGHERMVAALRSADAAWGAGRETP